MTRRPCAAALVVVLAACRRPEAHEAAVEHVAATVPQWVSVHLDVERHGGSAEEAADVIESAVNGVADLAAIRTEIVEGQVVTWLAFDGADPMGNAIAVREALMPALPTLPSGAYPTVLHHDRAHADAWILLHAADASVDALMRVADELREELQRQRGVAEVSACGPRKRTVLVLDGDELAAVGLAATRVLALARADPSGSLFASAIDVDEVRRRSYDGVPGDAFMTVTEEQVEACRVVTGRGGNGFALRVRYVADADRKAALTGFVDQMGVQLPAGIALQHEPFADGPEPVLPRVHVRAPSAAALTELLPAQDSAGAWLVVDASSASAELVGLADAPIAERVAARLATTPGITAVAETSRWSTVAVVGPDRDRLLELAPRLAELLGRDGTLTPWRERLVASAELHLEIDRARAADLGISTAEIHEAIVLHGEGVAVGVRKDAPNDVVVVRVGPGHASVAAWSEARVGTTKGVVPLASVVTASPGAGVQAQRCNRERCVGFAIPAAAAAALDLAGLTRALALGPGETLQLLPRPP